MNICARFHIHDQRSTIDKTSLHKSSFKSLDKTHNYITSTSLGFFERFRLFGDDYYRKKKMSPFPQVEHCRCTG
ncbi:unnamed protein product [Rhizophagus irregularis]|nr:unnamed protein product [Rhizophagus irregularis]